MTAQVWLTPVVTHLFEHGNRGVIRCELLESSYWDLCRFQESFVKCKSKRRRTEKTGSFGQLFLACKPPTLLHMSKTLIL